MTPDLFHIFSPRGYLQPVPPSNGGCRSSGTGARAAGRFHSRRPLRALRIIFAAPVLVLAGCAILIASALAFVGASSAQLAGWLIGKNPSLGGPANQPAAARGNVIAFPVERSTVAIGELALDRRAFFTPGPDDGDAA